MTFPKILLCLALLSLTACKTIDVRVNDDLRALTKTMKAHGVAWNVRQKIHFGEFHTSRATHRRSGYSGLGLLVYHTNRKKETYFQQKSSQLTAKVVIVEKEKSTDLQFFNKQWGLDINLNFESFFLIQVTPLDSLAPVWRFIVENSSKESNQSGQPIQLIAQDQQGHQMQFQVISEYVGIPAWIPRFPVGYAILMDGKPIAAFSHIHPQTVYMREDLSPSLQLVLASFISSFYMLS